MDWTLQEVVNGWLLRTTCADRGFHCNTTSTWIAKTPTEAAKIIEAEEKKKAVEQ